MLVGEYLESGLTQREFAASRGIGLSTLGRWLRILPRGGSPAPGFVQVRVADNGLQPRRPPGGATYRLGFAGQSWLEVSPGFDPEEVEFLTQLVKREAGAC